MTGATATRNTGEALLNDVLDTLLERVPMLPVDDPVRPIMTRMALALAHHLRRPVADGWTRTALTLVRED